MVVGSVVWLVLSLVLGFLSVSRQVDGFQRVPLPGQGEVSFTEPGKYILYYEGQGASEGNFPAFNAVLVAVAGNPEIPISDYENSVTYDFSGHSGRAVGTVQIDNPGRYLLRTESDVQGEQATVAVGSTVSGAIVRTLVLATVGSAILFLGGAALALVVAIRRHRRRRMLPAPAWSEGTGSSTT